MGHYLEDHIDKLPLLDRASEAGPSVGRQKEEDCIIEIPEESRAPKKAAEENQNQNQEMGKHISRLHRALVKINSSAYKPKLISIGPYCHLRDADSENSIKIDFQKSFFGDTKGFKVLCRKKLESLKDMARSWYADNTDHMSNAKFVDMLLLDGCFILEFFYKKVSGEDDGFMKVDGKVAQTLSDILLFENQLPFFVLFELHKLKHTDDDNEDALLKELIELVKMCYMNLVPKLTPPNVFASTYKPENLPKHLLEVVHSLCIPRNIAKSYEDCGEILEQINTATELEKNGVSFKKIGKIYAGYNDEEGPNFNANDHTTLFDIDFSWGIMRIPCFRIDDFTETFLRSIIAYEQHSRGAPRYFTDFAWFMDQLIDTPEDVNLLRRNGIIVNLLATDDCVAKLFNKMCEGVVLSTTLSPLINKVNRHAEKPWNIWMGKLRQDFYYSPWKLISAAVGGLLVSLGTAVSIKNLLR